MALPSTGPISLLDVRNELGKTGAISLNDSDVRSLAGKASGTISMSDLRGKSAGPPPVLYISQQKIFTISASNITFSRTENIPQDPTEFGSIVIGFKPKVDVWIQDTSRSEATCKIYDISLSVLVRNNNYSSGTLSVYTKVYNKNGIELTSDNYTVTENLMSFVNLKKYFAIDADRYSTSKSGDVYYYISYDYMEIYADIIKGMTSSTDIEISYMKA